MQDASATTSNSTEQARIPVTVFTGFLGAGKTTLILSLISKLTDPSRIVLLKNEFGDVKVDSELARESSIQVSEMVNGCLCCVLVGQMKNALLEIKEKQHPDRIIIETSGSAFPASIAWQLRELEPEGFYLDAIVTVVDCVNFRGYEDTSYTAKMQAQYTDLILLNKWELVSERELDLVIDRVDELNTDTPKVRVPPITTDPTTGRITNAGGISPSLVFGLDSRTFFRALERDGISKPSSEQVESAVDMDHHAREVDLIHIERRIDATDTSSSTKPFPNHDDVVTMLNHLDKDDVYRVKGFIRFSSPTTTDSNDTIWIVNWAFGRLTLTPSIRLAQASTDATSTHDAVTSPTRSLHMVVVLLTVMGRDLGGSVLNAFKTTFLDANVKFSPAHRHE